ncbi:MAG: carbohydrate kinase family protein [Patescibacteria group bacterium]|nr:carbohydrate kinase family protein [Patescibacteria group bacterium]
MKYDLIIVENLAIEEIRMTTGTKTITGGSSYFALYPAALISKKVGLVSVVGNDFDIRKIKAMGVDMKGTKVIKEGRTFKIYSAFSKDHASRTVTYERGVANRLTPKLFPRAYLNAKNIFLSTSYPPTQLKFARFLKKKSRSIIGVDTITHYMTSYPKIIKTIFSLADIIFMNKEEYDLAKKLDLLSNDKNKTLIIKKDKNGATCKQDRCEYHYAAPKIKLVDPTGAGDCLAGAFLVLRAKGLSVNDALRKAIRIASLSIKDFGIEHIRNYRYIKNIIKNNTNQN